MENIVTHIADIYPVELASLLRSPTLKLHPTFWVQNKHFLHSLYLLTAPSAVTVESYRSAFTIWRQRSPWKTGLVGLDQCRRSIKWRSREGCFLNWVAALSPLLIVMPYILKVIQVIWIWLRSRLSSRVTSLPRPFRPIRPRRLRFDRFACNASASAESPRFGSTSGVFLWATMAIVNNIYSLKAINKHDRRILDTSKIWYHWTRTTKNLDLNVKQLSSLEDPLLVFIDLIHKTYMNILP